jgi:thiol-disulfide isomerase/thioredoxin
MNQKQFVMKAHLTCFFIMLIPMFLFAQEQPSAIDLSNGIRSDLRKGEVEEAINKALVLIDLKSTYLVDLIHSNVTSGLSRAFENNEDMSEQTHYLFLLGLEEKENSKINKLIGEVLAWAKILNASNSRGKLRLVENFADNQVDTVNYQARAQRYSLLIAKQLDYNNRAERELGLRILDQNIRALQSNPYLDQMGPKAYDELLAAWSRFVLASSYFHKSQLEFANKAENLKKAAHFSLGPREAAFKSYLLTDCLFLAGSNFKKGYRKEYLDYLLENDLIQESLEIKADLCLLNPTDESFNSLRSDYAIANTTKISFRDFWKAKVSSVCKPLPVKEFVCPEDSLVYPIGDEEKWTFVDVWGSWCSPCVAEFPSLQEAYNKNINQQNSKLIITTWAFDNPEPMKKLYEKEGYTVPYTHIDNDLQTFFHIHSWPTKMLISPEGRYLKIPYGVDWQMFVKNYTSYE